MTITNLTKDGLAVAQVRLLFCENCIKITRSG